MKIYLFMSLNDVVGDRYYTDKDEVEKLVEEANKEHGGDFWYKTLSGDGEKDYKQMAKSLIGETMKDFFCNGFFGSGTYDLTNSEITKIYDSDDDNAIVIEVRKTGGKYGYGYFEGGWRDWKTVYEHLKQWTIENN